MPIPTLVAACAAVCLVPVASALAQTQASKLPEEQSAPPTARTAAPAPEDTPYPTHRVVYTNLVAARLNPIGLENQLDLSFRRRLYDSPALLFREAYAGIAFTPALSPAVARVGLTAELRPLSILMLSAGYYWSGFFGSFDQTTDYTSPYDDFSDTAWKARGDAGTNFSTSGTELQLRAQLLTRFGPIVLRNDTNFYRMSYDDLETPGADLLFHIRLDLLVPANGWAWTNDTDALYLFERGHVIGLRSTVADALYPSDVYQPGDDAGQDPNGPTWRVGPILAYRLAERPGSFFSRPTILLIAQWWLDHRFRTGEDVSQAIPYFVLGFSVTGDLWSSQ